jgi:hypothetical protein
VTAALLAAAAAVAGGPAAAGCRLALVLGIDVSRSVDAGEYRVQHDGIVAALNDASVRAAILVPRDEVALAVYEWSGQDHQALLVDWSLIGTGADIDRVAAQVGRAERGIAGPTALGAALDFGRRLLARAPDCALRTLDVSGDGRNNDGPLPSRAQAAAGWGRARVNGLAIGGHESDIAAYYAAEVIRGSGAFVMVARDSADFPRAIRAKLLRELAEELMGGSGAAGAGGAG